MSLITCCPSCGTKFRVVADQLRISDGWVRCGRCQEVFDASQALEHTPVVAASASVAAAPAATTSTPPVPPVEALLPQETELVVPERSPDAAQPQALVQSGEAAGYALPAAVPEVEADDALWAMAPGTDAQHLRLQTHASVVSPVKQEPALDPDETSGPLTGQATQATQALEPWEPADTLAAEEAQAQPWADALTHREPALETQSPAVEEAWMPLPQVAMEAQQEVAPMPAATAAADDADVFESAEAVPSFVRQAQRRAWWSQPAVRFVMGMLVTLLPLALVLQIALHERNTLVAWKPQWRPAFASMCVALRCELAPRRHIASVVITGSSFHEDVQPHHYRLGLSLQNQSVALVETPAVEVTLTDSQDQILVRKVLLPAEIGAPTELAPHSEWTGTLSVATQGLLLPVSGYRVMAFYP